METDLLYYLSEITQLLMVKSLKKELALWDDHRGYHSMGEINYQSSETVNELRQAKT